MIRGGRVGCRAGLLALLLLALTAASAAAEPNDGQVSGRLINKSGGGVSPAGVTITLVAFGRKEKAPVGQRTTQADADGRYAFTDLDRDANLVYVPFARYAGVTYPADEPFQLEAEQSHQADISVFETTTNDDAIQLERLNLLVMGADQGMVQMMEMGSLVNTGDRTFVTSNPQDQALARGVHFALPKGALGVQMQSGFSDQDLVAGVGGVQITSPLMPGRHEFALSFQVPYSGSNADLSLQLPYPTASFSVYLPNTGLQLNSSSLTPGQPTQLGGQSYALYTASNLPKSAMLPTQIAGLGRTGGLAQNQLALLSLGAVLFVLGAGVLVIGSRRRRLAAAADVASNTEAVEEERMQLVVRMAALDERFAAGEVSEREYRAERERGKRRLLQLTVAKRTTAERPA